MGCVFISGMAFGAGRRDDTDFPSRAITLIVPWSAGGGSDAIARMTAASGQGVRYPPGCGADAIARALARSAEQHLGVPIVVQNRPGEAGTAGLGVTAAAAPDGYTLTILPLELGLSRYMEVYPFDFSDFTMIMNLNTDPAVVAVRADAPWNTLQEFVAAARANPGELNIAHAGRGRVWHLAGLALAAEAGVEFSYVPFIGAGDAIAAIRSGRVQAMTFSGAEVSAEVRAGTMRVLGILDYERTPIFPEIPTAIEQGLDVVVRTVRGLGGPAGIPAYRVQILHEGFRAMMQEPVFITTMETMGIGIDYRNLQEYEALTITETTRILSSLVRLAMEGH